MYVSPTVYLILMIQEFCQPAYGASKRCPETRIWPIHGPCNILTLDGLLTEPRRAGRQLVNCPEHQGLHQAAKDAKKNKPHRCRALCSALFQKIESAVSSLRDAPTRGNKAKLQKVTVLNKLFPTKFWDHANVALIIYTSTVSVGVLCQPTPHM